MQRPLPSTDPLHFGAFTAQTAYAAGWSRSALAHAVASGRLIRVQHGVFVAADDWDDGRGWQSEQYRLGVRTAAAVLTIRPAVASHASAALHATLPLWEVPERACITVPPRYTGDAHTAHLHRATLPREHLLPGHAVDRTVCARTVLDMAREHGTEDAVVVGDAALERGLVDAERLGRCAEFCAGWPGMRRARLVLALLDGRSESPLESVSRLRLAYAGIPTPDLQTEIFSLDGRFLGRTDFYWDEFGVAGEVDGRLKYRERPEEVWWREKRRQEPMEDTGMIFVRWGRPDLGNMPLLAQRLRNAFRRGSRRPRSDRGWIARPTTDLAPEMRAGTALGSCGRCNTCCVKGCGDDRQGWWSG